MKNFVSKLRDISNMILFYRIIDKYKGLLVILWIEK